MHTGQATEQKAEHIEKIKFPQDLFPECRSSRKGFMRTRWVIDESKHLDMVNIHLFHDASNLVAMEKTPSPYAQSRQKALKYTLKCLEKPLTITNQQSQRIETAEVPLFIFGDFNFRLDTNKVIQRITDGLEPFIRRSVDNNEVLEVVYHRRSQYFLSKPENQSMYEDSNAKESISKRGGDVGNSNLEDNEGVFMTVGKKTFDCENMDNTFRAGENTQWLLELDRELDSFKNQLHEFRISFSPSYPFKEDASGGHSYMKTRCPAWCDRILFNSAARSLINYKERDDYDDDRNSRGQLQRGQKIDDTLLRDPDKTISNIKKTGDVLYMLMGNTVPMGDHKPVLLYFKLKLI